MMYIVAYDITDNRRRSRLFKAIKGFGIWSQFSVFECDLNKKQVGQLQRIIQTIIETTEDSVKIYPLCLSCLDGAEIIGIGRIARKPDIIIV